MRLLDNVCHETYRPQETSSDKPAIASQICSRGRASLRMLLDAAVFASDVGRPVWDFSVELCVLTENGLTHTDLRWLICNQYLESAIELRIGAGPSRCFQHGSELRLTRNSCFIPTDSGIAFIQQLLGPNTSIVPSTTGPIIAAPQLSLVQPPNVKPVWDRDRQMLRIGEQVIKQFKVPAPNQEMVLAAFHEEDWPVRIDDPLPPQADLEPKRRLHDTIVSLNRNHRASLIRFLGDGSGQGVRWEPRV